jgi:CDP-diacylglycerol---glycerol-3-phosphate 3-phosphatidyltransferase
MNYSFFPRMATIGKLLLSPLLLPVFLVLLLPVQSLILNIVLALLFIIVSFTDLIEAYAARRYGFVAPQDGYLDPLADTLLFCSTLIALLAAHKIFFYWVIILIGRELFVLGLRLAAHEHKVVVPVPWLAKLKTIVQLVCVTFIIVNPYQSCGFFHQWNMIEFCLLVFTILVSVLSAKHYFNRCVECVGTWRQQTGMPDDGTRVHVQDRDKQP